MATDGGNPWANTDEISKDWPCALRTASKPTLGGGLAAQKKIFRLRVAVKGTAIAKKKEPQFSSERNCNLKHFSQLAERKKLCTGRQRQHQKVTLIGGCSHIMSANFSFFLEPPISPLPSFVSICPTPLC